MKRYTCATYFHVFLNVLCSTETDMFFLAVSMVGTDFSMICQLFPHRVRSEIKVSDDNTYNVSTA